LLSPPFSRPFGCGIPYTKHRDWGGFEQAGILHPLSKEKEKKLKLLLGEVFPSVILNIISYNILIFKFFLYFSFSLFNFFTENGSKDAVLKKVGEFLL